MEYLEFIKVDVMPLYKIVDPKLVIKSNTRRGGSEQIFIP